MTDVHNVDICCGLNWGDEAKGKIVSQLLSTYKYDWVCRWNGGSNAGHTIYVNEKKYATHIIPAGIFHNIPCYIGPECFINYDALVSEMEYLRQSGFDISKVYISKKAHIVTDKHIQDDVKFYKKQQGSTGMGIAPCARDKYARKGLRIEDVDDFPFKNNVWLDDVSPLKGDVLCEGSQGFWLDINHGSYPYVTSSCTLPYSACSLGFPPQTIRNIYGATKVYDTRVGVDPHFSHKDAEQYKEVFKEIALIAEEYGTTTKRLRKIEWLNMDKLLFSINTTGCTIPIFSKIDILEKMNKYAYIYENKYVVVDTREQFIENVNTLIQQKCRLVKDIIYSNNPTTVNL